MNEERLAVIRHSFAHVMAEAVLQIFPEAKTAIGPAVQNGFYYDFGLPRALTPEDLDEIAARMETIIKKGGPFVKSVVSREEALKRFEDQPFKTELIRDLPDDAEISLYTQGEFTDLCRGPHVSDLKELNYKAFKLTGTAGAYWRGDEKRPMLQRIYGVAFADPKELKAYLNRLAEAEKRDHRKLGKELDFFSLHEEAGPGLVYWHPKGARIRLTIENFWRDKHYQNGYEMLYTPHVGKSWLWQTSGHLDFYKEGMYPKMEMDNVDYYVKPMNCPFHIMIYNNSKHSYRELPCRWAELGTVYRYEKAGALHGLLRVRGFTQDDAHIICRPDQVEDEIREVLRFSLEMLRAFGFTEFKAYISTKPEKAVGEEKDWDLATRSLQKAVEAEKIEYDIDAGGGAFYGPKIDLKIKDALGREWQLSTIQFDFNLPVRFDMVYTEKDGSDCRPFMIHRALLGSIERFFGILIEHYAGAFPFWLSPVQVKVIPVAEAFDDYASEIAGQLKAAGFRAETDLSDDRMNAKIRNAQKAKVPCMLILGDKEKESGTVSVRYRDGRQVNGIAFDELVAEFSRLSNEKE